MGLENFKGADKIEIFLIVLVLKKLLESLENETEDLKRSLDVLDVIKQEMKVVDTLNINNYPIKAKVGFDFLLIDRHYNGIFDTFYNIKIN